MATDRKLPRKLLIATLGAATVNYVSSCVFTSGNLVAPDAAVDAPSSDAAAAEDTAPPISGNLPAPADTGTSVDEDSGIPPISGNLPAPVEDSGTTADEDSGIPPISGNLPAPVEDSGTAGSDGGAS